MKIAIEICEENSEKLKQYISNKNAIIAQLADEYEQKGSHRTAEWLREPITPESFVTGLVLAAIRE
ncbi:MAG: hypothetical protein ABFD79_08510 [Phycisphaerales bacterium]